MVSITIIIVKPLLYRLLVIAQTWKKVSESFRYATQVVRVIHSKDNRFQVKVGTFAQNKSSSTLLDENWLANWQSRWLNSQSAIVVAYKRKSNMHDTNTFV